MRKSAIILVSAVLGLSLFSAIGASAKHTCPNGGARTAAGSCKNSSSGHVKCGDQGTLPVQAGSVRFYNNAEDGEVEACNDDGAGTTTGRLVVQWDAEKGQARVVLDSTDGQPQPVTGGYIIVQADSNPNRTGIWCSETGGVGDGYDAPRSNPGAEGGNVNNAGEWSECAPGN